MSIDKLMANKAYQAILEYCFNQDTKTNPTWTQAELDEEENKTEDQIPTGELEYRATKRYLPLLQHLYYYKNLTSQCTQGFK
jgi:hypothetical protein